MGSKDNPESAQDAGPSPEVRERLETLRENAMDIKDGVENANSVDDLLRVMNEVATKAPEMSSIAGGRDYKVFLLETENMRSKLVDTFTSLNSLNNLREQIERGERVDLAQFRNNIPDLVLQRIAELHEDLVTDSGAEQ